MIDFLDRETLPPAADRSQRQQWIAVFDALFEIPAHERIVNLYRGLAAVDAARIWAAARDLRVTTIGDTLFVHVEDGALFGVSAL